MQFFYSAMIALMLSVAFASCSKSDDDPQGSKDPDMPTGITYSSRNYTHAWLDSKTLLVMSTDGEHKKVIWTKLNADNMNILNQGMLDIAVAEDYNVLTTSGVVAYRKSDNKVFYFYYNKKETSGSNKTSNEPFFRIAVIDAATMKVEKEIVNKEAAQPTASAYGELLQQTIFFDENDNLYLSAFTSKAGKLLRIKKGEFDFEEGYNAFPDAKGKLLTIQYLGSGKVFAYAGDGSKTGIDDFAYFYAIIDVNAKTVNRIQFNGADLPNSSGSFSQRSAFNSTENKVYFCIDPKDAQTQVYVYDVATGNVTAGAKVADGYYPEQIRYFLYPTPHYDFTVTVANGTKNHGGMGRDNTHYIQSFTSLADPNVTIDYQGQGAEISGYTMESIYDNQYMYQVPTSNDRFSKLQFKDNKMTVIQEQKFI